MLKRSLLLIPPLVALGGVALLFGSIPTTADDQPRHGPLVNGEARAAITMATRHLVGLQNEDGSWTSDAGKKINDRYDVFQDGGNVPHVGVTSLAVLTRMISDPDQTSREMLVVWQALLSAVEPFRIWFWLVIISGLRATAQLRGWRTWVTCGLCWLIAAAARTAIVALLANATGTSATP